MSRKAVQPHQIINPTLNLTAAERKAWDDQVWNLIDLADYELCDVCGKDFDRHVIRPDHTGKYPTVDCMDPARSDR